MSRKRFEFLDHTADIKVRAFGDTLEQGFVNAAVGGFNFLIETDKIKKRLKQKISVKSKTLESLLFDFIDELIFLVDTKGFLFCDAKDVKISELKDGFMIECTALGDFYKNYETKGDLKAITYSEMKIEEKNGAWILEVVYDI